VPVVGSRISYILASLVLDLRFVFSRRHSAHNKCVSLVRQRRRQSCE